MLGTLELRPLPFKCDMAGPIKAPPICALQRRIWSFCIKGCRHIYTESQNWGAPLGWGAVDPSNTPLPNMLPYRSWSEIGLKYSSSRVGISTHSRISELTPIDL